MAGKSYFLEEKFMTKNINLLSKFLPPVDVVTYANRRDNIIKNGGCYVKICGHRVAYLYAIVDTCGAVVEVTLEGILAFFIKKKWNKN